MSLQAVQLQTEKMAIDKAYKKLAQLYMTMDTHIDYKHMVVAKILEDYVNIDYELPTSALTQSKMPELLNSTALELAAKKKDIEIFKFLIQQGADFTRKNKEGSTVLHQTIDPSIYSDESTHMKINARLPGNLFAKSVLDAHVELLNSSNPLDKHGMSHFHVACITNHTEAVDFFLKAGVSPNQAISNDSTNLPGYAPLHLAAKFGAVETLHLLLQTNVKIDAKNANGMSPLELLIREQMEIWIELRKLTESMTFIHLYFNQNMEMTDMILRKFDPQTQVVDEATGLSRLHIACSTMNLQVLREQLELVPDFQHSVNATSTLWPGYTPLHFAAHYEFNAFKMLLDAGADLSAVDSKGQTPFDICLRNFYLASVETILWKVDRQENVLFSNGHMSLLYLVFSLENSTRFEEFLKYYGKKVNARIPEDSPVCRGYTPLHFAVVCCERLRSRSADESSTDDFMTKRYRRCLETFLQLGADVTAKNSQGSTPVHLAFHFKNDTLIKMLLDRQTSAENPRDNAGLSHLHLACLANCPDSVRKLPRDSDDLDAPLAIGDFVWGKSSRIHNGATPLSIALSVGARETAEALVERGARIPEDEVERFAEICGAKLILQLHPLDVEGVLRHCEPKLIIAEMKRNAQLRDYLVERHGLTRLHVAVLIGGDVEKLTDDVNARVPLDSPVWPGCTALHLLMVGRRYFDAASLVARCLLDRGANVTLKNARGATPVHDAFDCNLWNADFYSLLDTLLRQVDANPTDSRGISHFHLAAAFGRVDVVEGFLKNGVDVDGTIDECFMSLVAGHTALHLAVIFGRDEVVNTLLEHGANVHCESVVGNRPIHVAAESGFVFKLEGIVESLMNFGADINVENLFGETPLEQLLKNHYVHEERLKVFLKYGCKVNVVNPMSNQGCLALALMLKDNATYKSLIDVYDHDELDQFGRNAIHNIVLSNRSLWNLPGINRKHYIPVTEYVAIIKELTDTGLDIDFQEMLGMTPLHLASMNQNVTGVIALLKCGADVNVNDKKGFPPIRASIFLGPTKLHAEILEHFRVHIWKLRFFKLHVSDFNLEAESKIHGRNSLKDDVTHSYHAEVQAMDKEKIGSIALRDFLCETGVVAAYPTMLHDLRRSIDDYFKANIDSLLKEFPALSCLLLLQYGKARKRLGMTGFYWNALKYLVNFEIPVLCSDRIFRFLSYDDLKNLAVASFE